MEMGMFQVKGIADKEAANKVLQTIHNVWGVRRAELHEGTGKVRFSYDENAASFHDFEQAVIEAGFSIEPVEGNEVQHNEREDI